MNYILHILVLLQIYALLAISANQKVGHSGLLSLGQAVFYGTGAYAIAIVSTKYGLNYWLGFLIAITSSIVMGLFFSFIAGKVIELYFSLATLAAQIVFFSVIYNSALTNGSYGIAGIGSPNIFGFSIDSPMLYAIYAGFWLLLIVVFLRWFYKTPLHSLIQATRDNEIAILNFGKNPKYYKRVSVLISSIISGLAGTIYASYVSYIDPSSFTLDESILILSIVLIGGSGRLIGSIVGALIYILLPEILKFIHIPDDIAANMRMILFGLLLIIIVRYKPEGVLGKK